MALLVDDDDKPNEGRASYRIDTVFAPPEAG